MGILPLFCMFYVAMYSVLVFYATLFAPIEYEWDREWYSVGWDDIDVVSCVVT